MRASLWQEVSDVVKRGSIVRYGPFVRYGSVVRHESDWRFVSVVRYRFIVGSVVKLAIDIFRCSCIGDRCCLLEGNLGNR